jgi:hypothetical protein
VEDVKGETMTIDFGAGERDPSSIRSPTEGQKVVDSIKWTGS